MTAAGSSVWFVAAQPAETRLLLSLVLSVQAYGQGYISPIIEHSTNAPDGRSRTN